MQYFLGSCLEIGAQWSIAKKDTASFERYMKQLKCYYLDYKLVEFLLHTFPSVRSRVRCIFMLQEQIT